jgi:hypothetical protein
MRLLTCLLALISLAPTRADAIPGFARRYKVSCVMCHNPVPVLNDFGEQFAGNGYRLASGEVPGDTVVTGDGLLTLAQDLGLAFRLEAYVREYTKGNAGHRLRDAVCAQAALERAPLEDDLLLFLRVSFRAGGGRRGRGCVHHLQRHRR